VGRPTARGASSSWHDRDVTNPRALHTAADLVEGRLHERLSDDEFLKIRRAVDRAADEQRLSCQLSSCTIAALPGVGAFDQVMAKQLKQQVDQSLDLYVLNQVIGATSAVTGNSSFSIANFYADLSKGRQKLTDTAGARLRPLTSSARRTSTVTSRDRWTPP
jgi:hypothetical protein